MTDAHRPPLKFEPSLDGIRAVAVLAVVIYHASPWLPGGWAGVDAFFVLSGYLITRLLAEERSSSGALDLRRFYIRRCLRLMPAFACLLAAEVALSLFSAQRGQILQSVVMAATYLMNWNRAFDWLPQGSLGHTWSLAMEEQFYILWPTVLLFILRRRPLVWIIGLIIVIMAWRGFLVMHGADPERTYNGFDTHADALLIGCALAVAPLSPMIRRTARVYVSLPLATVVLILFAFHFRTPVSQGLGLSLAAAASAWIMVAALQPGWLRTLLSARILTYTGRISYGWYLWHYPMLVLIQPHLPKKTGVGIALVFAAYPVAMLSYRFIEKPFLKMKNRFEPSRMRARPLSDAVSAAAPDQRPTVGMIQSS